MNRAVELLEVIGREPHRDFAAAGEAARAMPDGAAGRAFAAQDAAALRAALGVSAAMACLIAVPNDDEREFEDQPVAPDEQPDESDARAA